MQGARMVMPDFAGKNQVEQIPDVCTSLGDPVVYDMGSDALLLDIDGTIIDIAPTPEAVHVPESLKVHLSQICERSSGALALISGRPVGSIDELFAPLKLATVGCHGAEVRRAPTGEVERHALPLSTVTRAKFAEIGKLDPRVGIEDKHYTLAIHYRQAPELENTVFGMVNDRLTSVGTNLEVVCGKDVIEIKAHEFNKGTGLRRIMEREPFLGRCPIFLGDDMTDEDAFAVLPDFCGRGVSVGRLLPGAQASIQSPSAVRHWLAALAERNR